MGKRIRLGLIFNVNENWIGGTYYILNLISALGTLSKENQPIITILSNRKSDFDVAKKTSYNFIKYHNPYIYKRNLIEAVINKIGKILLKKDIIHKLLSKKDIDVLFPASNDSCFSLIDKKVFWFPDFQHIVYPNFFEEWEIEARNSYLKTIANSTYKLILSSNSAKCDWDLIDIQKNCSVNVIPFAVTLPSYESISFDRLIKEFNISKDYFIVSNQFWKHKNHFVVLKAALKLKEKNIHAEFVFTGKEDDYRNPGYYQSLLDFISENNLCKYVKIIGFVDRLKQLKLMQNAKAIIQPSLFEGWSTVVEDAKAMGKIVIASNIPVHKEQLQSSGFFFNPFDENSLLETIQFVESQNTANKKQIGYNNNIELFGQQFLQMLTEYCA